MVNAWPSHKSSEKRRFAEIKVEIYLHILGVGGGNLEVGGRKKGGWWWLEGGCLVL